MPAHDALPVEGLLGRWIIAHKHSPGLAWSGSRWVTHDHGIPTGGVQVSNFATREEAEKYVKTTFSEFYPPPFDF